MYAVTGVTGNVGGAVARRLLQSGSRVRAIVRNENKASPWKALGCEVLVADLNDATQMSKAFAGAEGVFVMIPPAADAEPGFPEVRAIIGSLGTALQAARPGRAVCLSTIGGQVSTPNMLNQLHVMEESFSKLDVEIVFLRAAWFMENSAADLASARAAGVIPSFLHELDKGIAMVATKDVGELAAELLLSRASPSRIIELEGPTRVSPNEIGRILSGLLGKTVAVEVVPSESWDSLFRASGMKNPLARMQMLDGYNAGWIKFERGENDTVKGTTTIESVLASLVLSSK